MSLVKLICLGKQNGFRFLDGRTANGTVGLASNGELTGTNWELTFQSPGRRVVLECLGNIPGSRFLDGRTGDGTVGLAPRSGGTFTGTYWELKEVPNQFNVVTLRCLGNIPGPRFLDGRTFNGTVGLAPRADDNVFTGTKWRILNI